MESLVLRLRVCETSALNRSLDRPQSSRRRWDHDHREQDELSRTRAGRIVRRRRMYAYPPGEANHGLANAHLERTRAACRLSNADPTRSI